MPQTKGTVDLRAPVDAAWDLLAGQGAQYAARRDDALLAASRLQRENAFRGCRGRCRAARELYRSQFSTDSLNLGAEQHGQRPLIG